MKNKSCVVCNPAPCTGFAFKGTFIHDKHLALKDGKIVQVKPYPEYNGSPIFERCPTCLNYSCNCSQRTNGDFDDLSFQVERAAEKRGED